MNIPKLFSPGPVLVNSNVRCALLHYDICHRSKEFEQLFQETQSLIKSLFQADDSYYSVIVSGSGTSANETVLSSIFNTGDAVLLVKNGLFGERLEEIIDKYEIPKINASFTWGEYPDVAKVEQQIINNPQIKVVAMVFHETSTGMINPVKEIGRICKKYNKLFYVDCVSAAGGEFVDVVENNISIATSVGGKCVGAFPGSAYVCAKESLLKSLTSTQCKNVYLSLQKHYQSAITSHQTPNTPNVTLFWSLNIALKDIMENGLENRITRYRRCAAIIREGVQKLGMRLLLSEYMSNTVTSVFLPEGIAVQPFLEEMERRGYVFYIGKGDYAKQNMIQIANMGEIYEQDCVNMLEVLKSCIDAMRS